MARRRSNGEGTIYRRKDGRWEAAVYVLTTNGTRKRVLVKPNRRATTYDMYESNVRLHIKPHIGNLTLKKLTVPVLQRFFTQRLADGLSVRKVQIMREVLSPALTRAMREELVTRNVAMLVELPSVQQGDTRPWSIEEVRRFLDVARLHQ